MDRTRAGHAEAVEVKDTLGKSKQGYELKKLVFKT